MDRVVLLLNLEITVNTNDVPVDDLISNLHHIVSKAYAEGAITNGTAAEVVSHNAEVLIADNKLSF